MSKNVFLRRREELTKSRSPRTWLRTGGKKLSGPSPRSLIPLRWSSRAFLGCTQAASVDPTSEESLSMERSGRWVWFEAVSYLLFNNQYLTPILIGYGHGIRQETLLRRYQGWDRGSQIVWQIRHFNPGSWGKFTKSLIMSRLKQILVTQSSRWWIFSVRTSNSSRQGLAALKSKF